MSKLIRRKKQQEKEVDAKTLNRRTFISMGAFAGLYAAGYGAWRWLYKSPAEAKTVTAGAHQPLRRALNQNELIFRRLFHRNGLSKTYPKSMAAKNVRVNGDIGLNKSFDAAKWQLQIRKLNGDTLNVTLPQLKTLPKTELVFDFKCVEGWDQIQYWGGVKFCDFITHFNLQDQAQLAYAGFVTPDGQYYVGIDMASAMHPQTILAYEMNGAPLTPEHGYPLRLIIPVKYGIKNLKRIQTISFSNNRPPDYWAEQGYDYYSGL